jgi:hypothetical protein
MDGYRAVCPDVDAGRHHHLVQPDSGVNSVRSPQNGRVGSARCRKVPAPTPNPRTPPTPHAAAPVNSATVLPVTSTAPAPATETPKRGIIAGAIALAGHVVVFLLALVGGSSVLFGGEVLLTIACLAVSAILFRRDWRYTGVGIMGGWFVGLLVLAVLSFA